MLTQIHPKLPMRDKDATRAYYNNLGFTQTGGDYPDYLMMRKDAVEIHFFAFPGLKPDDNYGQVYIRTKDIEHLYHQLQQDNIPIHPNGHLQTKPWGQKEFALLDPDNNLLTFGQDV